MSFEEAAMTPEPAPDQAPSAQTLRGALRRGLTAALKATEYAREADRYDALGQPDAAHRLRHRARILAAHLAPE
jgi:uncharacterized protein HemY